MSHGKIIIRSGWSLMFFLFFFFPFIEFVCYVLLCWGLPWFPFSSHKLDNLTQHVALWWAAELSSVFTTMVEWLLRLIEWLMGRRWMGKWVCFNTAADKSNTANYLIASCLYTALMVGVSEKLWRPNAAQHLLWNHNTKVLLISPSRYTVTKIICVASLLCMCDHTRVYWEGGVRSCFDPQLDPSCRV